MFISCYSPLLLIRRSNYVYNSMLEVFHMNEWLQRRSISKPVFLLIVILLCTDFALHGGLLVLKIDIHYSTVSGDSMKKTLSDDSKLLLVKADFKEIKRGDLVSIEAYDNKGRHDFLKRVIALPNENIKIKGKKVYINGHLLDEPYSYYRESSTDELTLTVPSDGYFVMGDNRLDSLDSRTLGPISKTLINYVVLKFKN